MDSLNKMTATNERTMRYPYTLGAQIRQFPYKYYFQHNWLFRYWAYGAIVSFPVFVYIHKLANSPENKKKWAEIRAREAAEHH